MMSGPTVRMRLVDLRLVRHQERNRARAGGLDRSQPAR